MTRYTTRPIAWAVGTDGAALYSERVTVIEKRTCPDSLASSAAWDNLGRRAQSPAINGNGFAKHRQPEYYFCAAKDNGSRA